MQEQPKPLNQSIWRKLFPALAALQHWHSDKKHLWFTQTPSTQAPSDRHLALQVDTKTLTMMVNTQLVKGKVKAAGDSCLIQRKWLGSLMSL